MAAIFVLVFFSTEGCFKRDYQGTPTFAGSGSDFCIGFSVELWGAFTFTLPMRSFNLWNILLILIYYEITCI